MSKAHDKLNLTGSYRPRVVVSGLVGIAYLKLVRWQSHVPGTDLVYSMESPGVEIQKISRERFMHLAKQILDGL